jgi:hypothetical protein
VRLPIIGVSEDRRWYQVEHEGRPGWVRESAFIQIEGELDAVPVVEAGGGDTVPDEDGILSLAVIFADDFESGNLDNWYSWDGEATIDEESGNHVLSLKSSGEWTGAAPDAPLGGDYSYSARVKVVHTQPDFADVFMRVRLGENYNVDAHLAIGAGAAGLGYFEAENWTPLDEGSVPLHVDEWYHMRVDVIGDEISLFVDGQLVAQGTQPNLGDGGVDVGTAPNGAIYVDNVVIRSLNQSPASEAPVRRVTARGALLVVPSSDAPGVGRVVRGERVYILGRTGDGDWVYVRKLNSGLQGWVSRDLLPGD